jgi:hypothetical protein
MNPIDNGFEEAEEQAWKEIVNRRLDEVDTALSRF